MSYEIREVGYADLLFANLLAEAGDGDGRFMARLREHWRDGSERFDRHGEILLGAFADDELVGLAGISLDPYEPEDGMARVRHVYVLRKHRGHGIAKSLMERIISHACAHFTVLRLHTTNPAAAQLYESLGFAGSTKGRETHRLWLVSPRL